MELDGLRRPDWAPGQLLAFSGLDGPTDFEHGLVARTAPGAPGLELLLPGRGRVDFAASARGPFTVASDWLTAAPPAGPVRLAWLDAHHVLLEGEGLTAQVGDGLAVRQQGQRLLVGSAAAFAPSLLQADLDQALAARQDWLRRQPLPATRSAAAHRAAAKALAQMKGQVCTPAGQIAHRWSTPDRWPHRAVWLWDSAFHAIGWRHLDAPLARDLLLAVFDAQRDDGFVPHMIGPDRSSAITQPPVLGLAAALVHQVAPERGWLREIYPCLAAYVDWDLRHRDSNGDGLVEWQIEGNPHCRSGESGMDNSPRFDTATQLDAVDFNAFLAHECEVLAAFARQLGRAAEARRWDERHTDLCQRINARLWDDEAGLYVDYDVDRDEPSPVRASAGFLPLLCGAPSPAQARRLAAHLENADTFGAPVPLPSVALDDVAHYAPDMWRGPMWVNVNWMVAMGLARYGLSEAAAKLRQATCTAIEDGVARFGTCFEYYDARAERAPSELPRKGRCDPANSPYHGVIHDYGWTATLYMDLVADATA